MILTPTEKAIFDRIAITDIDTIMKIIEKYKPKYRGGDFITFQNQEYEILGFSKAFSDFDNEKQYICYKKESNQDYPFINLPENVLTFVRHAPKFKKDEIVEILISNGYKGIITELTFNNEEKKYFYHVKCFNSLLEIKAPWLFENEIKSVK